MGLQRLRILPILSILPIYTPYTPHTPYTPNTPYIPYAPYTPYTPYTPYIPYTPNTPYTSYTPYTPYIVKVFLTRGRGRIAGRRSVQGEVLHAREIYIYTLCSRLPKEEEELQVADLFMGGSFCTHTLKIGFSVFWEDLGWV